MQGYHKHYFSSKKKKKSVGEIRKLVLKNASGWIFASFKKKPSQQGYLVEKWLQNTADMRPYFLTQCTDISAADCISR